MSCDPLSMPQWVECFKGVITILKEISIVNEIQTDNVKRS